MDVAVYYALGTMAGVLFMTVATLANTPTLLLAGEVFMAGGNLIAAVTYARRGDIAAGTFYLILALYWLYLASRLWRRRKPKWAARLAGYKARAIKRRMALRLAQA